MIRRSAGETSPTIAARDMHSLRFQLCSSGACMPMGWQPPGGNRWPDAGMVSARDLRAIFHGQDGGALRVRDFLFLERTQ